MQAVVASTEGYLPLLYRAASDFAAWDALLVSLRTGLRADAAAILAMGPEEQVLLFAQEGMDDRSKDRFLEGRGQLSGKGTAPAASRNGAAKHAEAAHHDAWPFPHCAEARLPATALYARATLVVLRSSAGEAFGPEDHNLLRRLAPHVTTVLHLWHKLQQLRQKSALLQQLSHGFDLGYMLLDRHGRPLLMSDAARETLQRNDGLRLEHGALCIDRQPEQAELLRLLAAACAPQEHHGSADAAIRVPRAASPPLHLLFRPLPTDGGTPCAMVVLHDPEERPAPRTAALRRLYRLLPSEIRLAEALAAGLDVKQAAVRMHTTENSARTLLKSVFRKMGVSSQAGLLRAVLSLPADT